MAECNTGDFREKEVVNLCDGRLLGFVSEIEFDVVDGRITAIVVPGRGGFLGIGGEDDLVIPWCRIEKIGEDSRRITIEGGETLADLSL